MPLVIVGAVVGMIVMRADFGFMLILGLLSLAGSIVNNGIYSQFCSGALLSLFQSKKRLESRLGIYGTKVIKMDIHSQVEIKYG